MSDEIKEEVNPETKFLRIFKNFFEHEIWREKRKFSKAECWIDILNEVRYSEKTKNVVIKNSVITCGQGQCVYSLDTWATRWGMNKSSARRVLETFKKCNMIETENVSKTTRLTVLKYKEYAIKRHDYETEMKQKRNDSETILTPTEEGKEREDGKEGQDTFSQREIESIDIFELFVKSGSKSRAFHKQYHSMIAISELLGEYKKCDLLKAIENYKGELEDGKFISSCFNFFKGKESFRDYLPENYKGAKVEEVDIKKIKYIDNKLNPEYEFYHIYAKD